MSKIPKRISRLSEIAQNLWWSWHTQARDLFRALDYPLWRVSHQNPVKQLLEISPTKLEAAARDSAFLSLYDSVVSAFDAELLEVNTWFRTRHSQELAEPIAYFSAEFAIDNSLPIYASEVGILAGDICKEASDLGLPLVAVGFMYPQGYFHQAISAGGRQEELYRQLDFQEAPLCLVLSSEGNRVVASVELGKDRVSIGAWQVRVGRTVVYLLDTNLEENASEYQQVSSRLYVADKELRIQQQMVLGIGGVRVLRSLGINPAIWHANDGYTTFMMLERVREEVKQGMAFSEAVEKVRSTTVFTSHTFVTAGQDDFPAQLVEKYFYDYWDSLGIDRKSFLGLGQNSGDDFSMTALAFRMSGWNNGVGQLHGAVLRKSWHVLWPDVEEDEVPISHITNGIHLPTWIAPEMSQLFQKYLGADWLEIHDDPRIWVRLLDIPDDELWTVHQVLKRKLIGATVERARQCSTERECTVRQVLAMGALLDPDALTIGFARPFTYYQRPGLVFQDIERLKCILNDQQHPVQIVFAGKSHPSDFQSKYLLRQVYAIASGSEFQGRIAFVEDYDMLIARYLVQGVDIWLNNPRRMQQASGISGMKASINGVINLAMLDGWWQEGYNGVNGWAISSRLKTAEPREEDRADAEELYHLLEYNIVPLYYDRDQAGTAHRWIRIVKEAIRSVMPVFSARRMVKEYVQYAYHPTAKC